MEAAKYIPKVGEHLYTWTPCNSFYVAAVRRPWTVDNVRGNYCVVRAARPVFNGPQYYDSLPDHIEDDPHGKLLKLWWNDKKKRWQESPAGQYPQVAVFGEWDYYPYLD